MMERFTKLIIDATSQLNVKFEKSSLSITTAGWEGKLYFVVTEDKPMGAARAGPFITDMLGLDGPMWKPLRETAKQYDFLYVGGNVFWDCNARHLLRVTA